MDKLAKKRTLNIIISGLKIHFRKPNLLIINVFCPMLIPG